MVSAWSSPTCARCVPGVQPQQIIDNTGWEVDLSRAVPLEEPTFEEIRLLRMEVDPDRHYLGRKKK